MITQNYNQIKITRYNILFKHEYLRSRAYICLSLSSSSSHLSSNFVLFIIFLTSIEILVLSSWIPASKEFFFDIMFKGLKISLEMFTILLSKPKIAS